MTREIAYILLATAGGCALLLVLLLAWHELSGRSRASRYRSNVSANRLAIRQEQRESHDRLLAELDRRFGRTPGTSLVEEQMRAVEQEIRRVDRSRSQQRAALGGLPTGND